MADKVPASLALWKPFDDKGTTPLRHDIVCVHTMVGTLAGSWSWANGAGRAYWHFGLSGGGEMWQCHDLRYRSAANLEGNPYVIPIETADMGHPFGSWSGQCGDVPAWTGAQIESLIEVIAWLCVRYDIPPSIIPDTQAGRRGLAYHRQGVPSSPEWESGNLKWSSSTGKCCPDWRRIAQFKDVVVPGVRALVRGEDMPLNDTDKTIIRHIIRQELYGDDAAHTKGLTPIIREEVRAVVEEMMSTSGSVVRQEGRVLARLGTEDALKAATPSGG